MTSESYLIYLMFYSRFETNPSHLFRVLTSSVFTGEDKVGDSRGGDTIIGFILSMASLGTFLFW